MSNDTIVSDLDEAFRYMKDAAQKNLNVLNSIVQVCAVNPHDSLDTIEIKRRVLQCIKSALEPSREATTLD